MTSEPNNASKSEVAKPSLSKSTSPELDKGRGLNKAVIANKSIDKKSMANNAINNKSTENPEAIKSDKPEVLKHWKIKLLVLILCAISFFAGWASHQTYSNKQCWEAGAAVTVVNKMSVCEMP